MRMVGRLSTTRHKFLPVHKAKHRKKPKKRKKRKKPKKDMGLAEVILKVVFTASTRPSTTGGQVANWLAPVEGWTDTKVATLVSSTPVEVGATQLDSTYRLKIHDQGIGGDGERRWHIYPKRVALVDINDGTQTVWLAHLDDYYRDLQAEIRVAVASAPVAARATILRWHLHLGSGITEDEI